MKRYHGWELSPIHWSKNQVSPEMFHFVDELSPTIQKYTRLHDTQYITLVYIQLRQ